MRARTVRLGVLLASVLSLLGVTMAPAEATQAMSIAFVGDATLTGGGFGYPCTVGDIPGNVPGCLVTAANGVTVTTKTGKLGTLDVNATVASGNTRALTFSTTVCVGGKVNVLESAKGTGVDGPLCSMALAGAVTGYCGLFSGGATGAITIGAKTLNFTMKMTSIGATIVIKGTYSGAGKAGDFNGLVVAVPDQDPATGSCTNQTVTHCFIFGFGFWFRF